ncbi:MAG TPA: hypothetical protein PK177_17250, partial [Burkholderiaceae bacterium]|nr:hypothetical protein [Burkholderiaceae bacterium]
TVYLPRLRDGGRIFVNGRLLASVRQADADWHVRWMRPIAFTIPSSLLAAGANTLQLRIASSSPGNAMGVAYVGPETELAPRYASRLFWSHTSAQVTVAAATTAGLLVVLIWLRRRLAFEFGLFGLAATFWGLRTLSVVVPVYPQAARLAWSVFHYSCTGGFVIAMTLFMLRVARLHRPAIERALIAYWPTGPLLLALGGIGWEQQVEHFYQAGLVVVATAMLAATAVAGWRRRTPGVLALCVGVLFGLALGVRDYLLTIGLLDYEGAYLMHIGANGLLLTVGVLLTGRFVQAMRESADVSASLSARVRKREDELLVYHERLRQLERERTASEERQRIIQDVHDGLGSQLVSSLAMVERGTWNPAEVARALREAIEDMRTAVDTLALGDEDLPASLRGLVARLAPRFRAAGIELTLHIDDAANPSPTPADTAHQVLRILQEALANTLKHSGAAHADVAVTGDPDKAQFVLQVSDDGRGFDPAVGRTGGRGLGGMRCRAAHIGARLDIDSHSGGSRVRLSLPVNTSARAPA